MVQGTQDTAIDSHGAEKSASLTFEANGQETINIPTGKFISDSEISRDGQDLTLTSTDGEIITVTDYFTAEQAPILQSPDGSILTENLVNSFLKTSSQFAQAGTLNDESPIGAIEELEGSVTITRTDGTSETVTLGTPVYEGDTIETSADGAANILFLDDTSMAVSESARISIDNYKFDAATESGETNLSVLRGVFVYTSGLIGRDDPDDVLIETPVGSIGIRGTIIAGNIKPNGQSEITVLEGAIVVSNGQGETTLSEQYETVQINGFNDAIEGLGVKEASEMKASYGSVSNVIPQLFSSINDNIRESKNEAPTVEAKEAEKLEAEQEIIEVKPEEKTQEDQQSEILESVLENQKTNLGDKAAQESQNKENVRDVSKENTSRLQSQEDGKDFFFNRLNPQLDGSNNVNTGNGNNNSGPPLPVNASDNNVRAGVMPSGKDFNGDGQNDFVNGGPNLAAGKGAFRVADGANPGTQLINAEGVIGQGLGADFDFIGDINNDGKLDFVVSSTNGINGKYEIFEIGNNTPTSTVNGNIGDQLGTSVTGLGDFDGNGLSDYAVGATGASGNEGRVEIKSSVGSFIITGSPNQELGSLVENIGDINGDGLTDLLTLSNEVIGGNHQAQIHVFNGTSATLNSTVTSNGTDQFITGAGIGDINGDGYDDFALSIDNGVNVETFAIYGKENGIGSYSLADLNNPNNALKVTHNVNLGIGDYSIKALGDHNGDGFDDFQVGVAGGPQFLIEGQETGNTSGASTASAGNKNLVNDSDLNDGNQVGVSLRGGNSDNIFTITDQGAANKTTFKNIDGGLGNDTIYVNTSLDFTDVNFEQISQIEHIDLGLNANVTLTKENIFNLLKSSDTLELRIDGEHLTPNQSQLTVTGGVTGDLAATLGDSDGATSDPSGYQVFEVGAYTLYIDNDINLNVV